jgi:hypothetical protein
MQPYEIKARLFKVRQRIAKVAQKSGRNLEDIKLVAAVKYASEEQIKALVSLGVLDLAENRAQRLRDISDQIKGNVAWHFIGRLQKNKVKIAVERCELIQSVDSIGLAKTIDKLAYNINKVQKVLIQLKISKEKSKTGVAGEEFDDLLRETKKLPNIKVEGLMAIAPLSGQNEVRASFKKAAEYFQKMEGILPYKPKTLSMGMSGDFEIAVEEGSNMVRIGSLLFGG